MRYSPYVTYGHQGLVLGQHPAQALSGNSSVLLDLQFLFKDHYSAKGYTPQSILALDRNNRFLPPDTSCGDYAVPMVPANYSDTDSDLERTEDYVFLQVSAI